MELTVTQLDAIWNAGSSTRQKQARNVNYYDGVHQIVGRSEVYADGIAKSEIVTNWIAYGVDSYVGALTSSPFSIQANESGDISTYQVISDEQNLDIMDVEHLRTSLIQGLSIEVHEFNDGQISITRHDPREWALVRDDLGVLKAAIRQVVLQPYSVYQDQILTAEKTIMTVYTDTTITDYERGVNIWNQTNQINHGYGRVPVVVWAVNTEQTPLITDDLVGQQDEYNDIDTISGDDLRNNTNAKLVIQNCDAGWLMSHASEINAMNMIPLPDGAEASYLQKGNDVARIESRLGRVRQNIHMRMGVPDIEEITGATGSTSGIALRLKFTTMIQKANSMIHYLKQAITDRINLINAINGRLRRPQIEGYEISITFVLPTNRIEEWANIGALKGIVSHKTQLALLSDIKDPEQELDNVQQETEAGNADIQSQLLRALTTEDVQATQIEADLAAQGR